MPAGCIELKNAPICAREVVLLAAEAPLIAMVLVFGGDLAFIAVGPPLPRANDYRVACAEEEFWCPAPGYSPGQRAADPLLRGGRT